MMNSLQLFGSKLKTNRQVRMLVDEQMTELSGYK